MKDNRLCIRCLNEDKDCVATNKVKDDLGNSSYLCDSCYLEFQHESLFFNRLFEDEE